MAEISDETLEFIVQESRRIDYGEIVIRFNANLPQKVDVEVIKKVRFKPA